MKVLVSSILVLGLIGFVVPLAFAEPQILFDGSVHTAILLTPEFEVDTSEFGSTGEIILDVKFERSPDNWDGLTWVTEDYDYENEIAPNSVEVYEKYESQRMFFISIKDVTNEEKQKLKKNQFVVTSNDQFIESRYNENHDNFEVEVLNIDNIVRDGSVKETKIIQTQLRLSSPELIVEKDYEILIWTDTRSTDPVRITLPTIQETPTPEPTPSGIIEVEEQIKEIPEWIKGIFGFYYKGEMGDSELIAALQYLIQEGIIEV